MIRSGATLVEGIDDILAELGAPSRLPLTQTTLALADDELAAPRAAVDPEALALLTPPAQAVFATLGELAVTTDRLLDACALSPPQLAAALLELELAGLAQACAGTRFVLDHCGNPDVQARDRTQWRRDIERIARCRNVVCKVSGIVASAKPGAWSADDLAPIVNHTLDAFGPDRVMFAGDWPVCTLAATFRQWVEALKAIVKDRKEEDQRKLFHDNAARFYGI